MILRRAWLWIALSGLVIVLGCLAFVGSIVLPEWRFAQLRHEPEAVELVAAIETYHRDVGLWPQYVEDLQPQYLSQLPRKWTYYWSEYEDHGPCVFLHGDARSRLEYLFPPDIHDRPAGWRLVWELGPVHFGELASPVDRAVVSREELGRRRLKELQRRIDREPDNEAHEREMRQLKEQDDAATERLSNGRRIPGRNLG